MSDMKLFCCDDSSSIVQQFTVSIGIDSTDSADQGGCTTYSALRLMRRLESHGAAVFQFPRLIRLNPNVPWKTRGNGAVAFTLRSGSPPAGAAAELGLAGGMVQGSRNTSSKAETEDHTANRVAELGTSREWAQGIARQVREFMCNDSSIKSEDGPGWVIFSHTEPVASIPLCFQAFYQRALVELLDEQEAWDMLQGEPCVVDSHGNRSIVGATAALGAIPNRSWTFELLAYRKSPAVPRDIDPSLICDADQKYSPVLFNNCVPTKDGMGTRCIAIPKGPDSVQFGLRGHCPTTLLKASEPLITGNVESVCTFISNQHSAAHWSSASPILKRYWVYRGIFKLATDAKTFKGGHAWAYGIPIDGAVESDRVLLVAFQKSGVMNRAFRRLLEGDLIEVVGGVYEQPERKGELSIQLEGMRVVRADPIVRMHYPRCPDCGSSTMSAGKDKGVKCKKCSFQSKTASRDVESVSRDLSWSWYVPDGDNARHLSPIVVIAAYPSRVSASSEYVSMLCFSRLFSD